MNCSKMFKRGTCFLTPAPSNLGTSLLWSVLTIKESKRHHITLLQKSNSVFFHFQILCRLTPFLSFTQHN